MSPLAAVLFDDTIVEGRWGRRESPCEADDDDDDDDGPPLTPLLLDHQW